MKAVPTSKKAAEVRHTEQEHYFPSLLIVRIVRLDYSKIS